MISWRKIFKSLIALNICIFSFNVFAADQAAKEETTPPAEDGPLTAEQIPPINK